MFGPEDEYRSFWSFAMKQIHLETKLHLQEMGKILRNTNDVLISLATWPEAKINTFYYNKQAVEDLVFLSYVRAGTHIVVFSLDLRSLWFSEIEDEFTNLPILPNFLLN